MTDLHYDSLEEKAFYILNYNFEKKNFHEQSTIKRKMWKKIE